MTPSTAATAIKVVRVAVIINRRTLATTRAASGSSCFSSASAIFRTMTNSASETVTIAENETGIRIDRVLAAHLATLSRSRLKALIVAGQVTIGGRTIRDP